MSNERNGASRGDVIKPSKTSPPIRRKEKGGLRANLAVRPYPIYRSTRASRAITPSLSFTYAGRYPVVYELFSLSGRDDNCLSAGRLGLPLWCSNTTTRKITCYRGHCAGSRRHFRLRQSHRPPGGEPPSTQLPPDVQAHWGGDNQKDVAGMELLLIQGCSDTLGHWAANQHRAEG